MYCCFVFRSNNRRFQSNSLFFTLCTVQFVFIHKKKVVWYEIHCDIFCDCRRDWVRTRHSNTPALLLLFCTFQCFVVVDHFICFLCIFRVRNKIVEKCSTISKTENTENFHGFSVPLLLLYIVWQWRYSAIANELNRKRQFSCSEKANIKNFICFIEDYKLNDT